MDAARATMRAAPERAPLAGTEPLIDVHAHFWHPASTRQDWAAINAARLRAGERIGITWHVASILGTWGQQSPTYFASPADLRLGNDVMFALHDAVPDRVRSYVHVNPNDPAAALAEIDRGVAAGAIGVKLAASRRADDPLLDPIAARAAELGLPVLHHIWQWRRRDWPMQEASDGVELARLAERHPRTTFILAHIGGGGDYRTRYAAVADLPNVVMDLSGSGVDRGMLDAAHRRGRPAPAALGVRRDDRDRAREALGPRPRRSRCRRRRRHPVAQRRASLSRGRVRPPHASRAA